MELPGCGVDVCSTRGYVASPVVVQMWRCVALTVGLMCLRVGCVV